MEMDKAQRRTLLLHDRRLDWLTRGKDWDEARQKFSVITAFLVSVGLGMADEKYEEGQELTCPETGRTGTEIVYLGVLYNTLHMTQSFDRTRAKLLRIEARDQVTSRGQPQL